MRHVVVLEGAYGLVEDALYAAGDAEDWIHRNQADFSDWADKVATGLMSVQEMKRRMNEQFANGAKQIQEARRLATANGRRMGFSHLHADLLKLDPLSNASPPRVCVVMPLPEGA